MSISAVDHCANIVALEKNKIKYGMCVAWATQIDSDKLIVGIGSQSVTGRVIKVGDIIGFSSLGINQKNIALQLGKDHSDTTDKFANIDYEIDDGAILIKAARTMIKCKVIDILHLKGNENAYILYLQYIDTKENADTSFLHMSDM